MKVTKRDTIIIAVLLNISLLALLFAFASRQDDKKPIEKKEALKEVVQAKEDKVVQIAGEEAKEPSKEPVDEIDQVLQEYALQKKVTSESAPSDGQENGGGFVTVKRGDSISKIAKAHRVSQSALIEANNLKSNALKEGQKLKIPGPFAENEAPKAQESSSDDEEETKTTSSSKKEGQAAKYYTIKNGDSPWKIAKKFHLKYEDLLRLNNLDEEKAKNLKIGQKIRIR